MGWFWADPNAPDVAPTSKCPVNHKALASSSKGGCPVDHKALAAASSSSAAAGGCPVKHKATSAASKNSDDKVPAVCPVNHEGSGLNPLNNMPTYIPSSKMPGQQIDLPTQRTISTIPRGEDDNEGNWEYPSPQQMFNAMVRKGKGDGIPEDAVESMVDVHNFLNEGAWQEILQWEKPYTEHNKLEPRLLKFTGRPDDMSPRARMYLFLSKWFPNTFDGNPPFDRHDWTVLRPEGQTQDGKKTWRQVRYVIDYYGGPDNEEGMPTFFLDVRPALDNPLNAYDRFKKWSGPVITKALGKQGKEIDVNEVD